MILQNKPTNFSPLLNGPVLGYFSNSQIQERISHFESQLNYISSIPSIPPAKKPSQDSYASIMSTSSGSTNLEPSQCSATSTLQNTRSRNGSISERDKSPASFNNSSESDSGHDNASETSSNSENHGFSSKSRYKTELCRSFQETGYCRYQNKCQYAHGEHELRQVARHQKYKSELCHNYHYEGTCMYGIRCCFIHQIQRNNVGRAASQNIELIKLKQPGRLHAFLEQQQQDHYYDDSSIPLTFAFPTTMNTATPTSVFIMDNNNSQLGSTEILTIHPQQTYSFDFQDHNPSSHQYYNSYASIYREKEEQIDAGHEKCASFDKKLKSKREPNL